MDKNAKDAILRARARSLAQEPRDLRQTQDERDLLVFVLGGGQMAVESTFVREVLPLKEITPLPGTPPFVLGIINARGQILSVVDINRFFGFNQQDTSNSNKIIVIENGLIEFGILVEEVAGMMALPIAEIQPPPVTLANSYGDYLKGVTQSGLLVFNMERILSDGRLIVQEEVV